MNLAAKVAIVISSAVAAAFLLMPMANVFNRSVESVAGTTWVSSSGTLSFSNTDGSLGISGEPRKSFSYREDSGFVTIDFEGGEAWECLRYGTDRLLARTAPLGTMFYLRE